MLESKLLFAEPVELNSRAIKETGIWSSLDWSLSSSGAIQNVKLSCRFTKQGHWKENQMERRTTLLIILLSYF